MQVIQVLLLLFLCGSYVQHINPILILFVLHHLKKKTQIIFQDYTVTTGGSCGVNIFEFSDFLQLLFPSSGCYKVDFINRLAIFWKLSLPQTSDA